LRRASVVFVVALLACCGAPVTAFATDGAKDRMIQTINEARAGEAGLPALRSAPDLDRSAGAFARWLVRHDTFGHRPSVSVNHAYPHCGEALAIHYSLRAQVGATVRAWLGSPTHRALVLTSSMNLVGIGHASGHPGGRPRTVWVVQVARRG
jgi:uncharacterized protein YkwD